MVGLKQISQELRSSDTITKLQIIPLVSTVTSVALVMIKALSDMKYTKCLAPQISSLKYHSYQELFLTMLPLIGTVFLIVKLATQIIKKQELAQEERFRFEHEQRLLQLEAQIQRQQRIDQISNRARVKKVEKALLAYVHSNRLKQQPRFKRLHDLVPDRIPTTGFGFQVLSTLAFLSISALAIRLMQNTSFAAPEPRINFLPGPLYFNASSMANLNLIP